MLSRIVVARPGVVCKPAVYITVARIAEAFPVSKIKICKTGAVSSAAWLGIKISSEATAAAAVIRRFTGRTNIPIR